MGRRRKRNKSSGEEHYYGKDGVTKSRAIGVTILMGAFLLFQIVVFLLRDKEDKNREEAKKEKIATTQNDSATQNILFKFNPNNITPDSLILLGFTPKQAQVVINYREKGGVFRKKEDFAKVYSVSEQMYERLEEYIDIPPCRNMKSEIKKERELPTVKVNEKSNKEIKPKLIVELNSADSAELVKLYGIGAYYAKKILEYRERIGNFYSPEQLMEIKGIDSTRYNGFKDNIVADRAKILKFSLDTASREFLSAHPYIGPYAARGILLLRQRFGAEYCTIENLKKERLLSAEICETLSNYLVE